MSVWGPLAERFDGAENRQHKLLTIDGGGIRGVMSIEILSAMERKLAAAHGVPQEDFRLSDFFDYVGGTSTGAVIAAGVARGLSMQELLGFYVRVGPDMFDNRLTKKLRSFATRGTSYDATPLANELKRMFGADTTLEPEHLKCLFLAVTRNQTTDSAWPISSNPLAKYNDLSRSDSNLRLPLWRIVRASTAAPMVFQAETIQWDADDPDSAFLFVDGGVTPYNNPAWLIARMATDPAYKLNWAKGEDKLMVVSVGTGTSPKGDDGSLVPDIMIKRLLANRKIIGSLIQGNMVDQDINCRQIGRCVFGQKLDGEVGDMIPQRAGKPIPLEEDLGRAFLYGRYNAHLTRKALDELGLFEVDERKVQKLNSVEHIDQLRMIGQRIGEDFDTGDFRPFMPQ